MTWRAKAQCKLKMEPIYTGDRGRPIGDRPDPDDFKSYEDFLGGLARYREQAARGFSGSFRKAANQ